MNNMAYLDQISASNRPSSAPKTGLAALFSPKFLMFIGASLAAFVFILILGGMLSNLSNRDAKLTEQLYYRLSNLSATIAEYNPNLKSSSLRAMGNSLSGVLTNTNRDLEPILNEQFKVDTKKNKSKGKLFDQETEYIAAINEELYKSQLNGLLDRDFTREMTLQIALINSLESEIAARTKKPALQKIMEDSSNSLSKLYEQFSNYADKAN